MLQAPISTQSRILHQAVAALRRHPRLKRFVKAAFDYTIIIPALLLLSPLLLTISLLIKLESPGPVFFRRRMVGLNGREFYAYKFRTVFIDHNAVLLRNRTQWVAMLNGHNVRDPRLTRVGYYLRRCGLDELPRLLNILTRDMSLVGPQAVSRKDVLKYGRKGMDAITSVLPGLTGPGLVVGQTASSEDRLSLDLEYINNWSPWLDMKIIFGTFTTVWRGQAI